MFLALLLGSVFGGLSVVMVKAPDLIGSVAILLLPGAVVAIIVSGNVHVFSTWALSLGNGLFYFGISYLLFALWKKRTRVSADNPSTDA
jgi:hypothetical protein